MHVRTSAHPVNASLYVVDVDTGLATNAARLPLPLADGIIYATAQRYKATLWTQDEHFNGLPGVKFFSKDRE